MNVIAKDIKQFRFDCSETKSVIACTENTFDIENVNDVDIICAAREGFKSFWSFTRCRYSRYNIYNVDNLDIACHETNACLSSVYNINNVKNGISLSCDAGCNSMAINISNADNLNILCEQTTRLLDNLLTSYVQWEYQSSSDQIYHVKFIVN